MTTLGRSVIERYLSPYFFETGTSGGHAVQLALDVGFEKIFSVEIDERLYNSNVNKFKKEIDEGRVFLFLGDTMKVMPNIIKQYIDKPCTFWLDAHVDGGPCGEKRCPLLDELDFIKSANTGLVHNILCDDRRCLGNDWWGKGITEQDVIRKIKEINSKYTIKFEDGHVPADIIAAKVY